MATTHGFTKGYTLQRGRDQLIAELRYDLSSGGKAARFNGAAIN